MISDFLQPVHDDLLNEYYHTNSDTKEFIHLYQEVKTLEQYHIAMIGVEDSRGFLLNAGSAKAPDEIRKQLYQYAAFNNGLKLLDLGNIKAGATYVDTLVALVEALHVLFKQNIIVVILGGDAALASAQFKAYEIFENPVTVSHIASKVEWENKSADIYKTYLKDFFMSSYLKKYNLLAYQSYLIHEKQLTFLQSKNHNALRVGKIREHVFEAEPLLREAGMVTYNVNAMRFSDAPGQPAPSPNGLFGDEACALARYSGMSEQLMSIGFYDYNPELDISSITAKQLGQMIWYFIEGISLRRHDYPIVDEKDFNTYIVQVEDAENDFIFLKSKKSDRWWMKMIYEDLDIKKHVLIPCTYKDYLSALNNEIPERWMREWMRLN